MYSFSKKSTYLHPGGDGDGDRAQEEAQEPLRMPVNEAAVATPFEAEGNTAATYGEHAALGEPPLEAPSSGKVDDDSKGVAIDSDNDNDDEADAQFADDPTFQSEQQQQHRNSGGSPRRGGGGDGDRKTRSGAAGSLLASGYNTSGAMNRFQAKRGVMILSEFVSPAPDTPVDEALDFLRNFVKTHNATPPKPWRQIRFDLPATVAELRLVPPSLEPVQYKTPVIPSPCLVLLLDGAIPEGMSQKDYMVQMIQYVLDLMKYNNAATAITTLKFIKKGNELAQLVVTFGLDVRLAVRMLNSLQEAGVRAGFGQPIQDYKPNATFAVTDYKLTLNDGAGIRNDQVLAFLTPFRETMTVDINVIDGYNKGVFYVPVKRPETVYSMLWNPYCSVLVQAELFTRYGVLITMAECPHFFLQKGVPYHIQKQQMELEKAKLLLLRQQRGDIDGVDDVGDAGTIYDYVHTASTGGGGGTTGDRGKKTRDGADDGFSDDSGFSDDDDADGEAPETRRRRRQQQRDGATGGSGSTPNWLAQAEQVSLFTEDDLLALKPGANGKAKPPVPSGLSTSSGSVTSTGLTFVAEEDEAPISNLLKAATAKAAAAPPAKPSAAAAAAGAGVGPAAAAPPYTAPYGRGRGGAGEGDAVPYGRGGRGFNSYEAAAAVGGAAPPYAAEGPPPSFAETIAQNPALDLPELVSDHDDDDDDHSRRAGNRDTAGQDKMNGAVPAPLQGDGAPQPPPWQVPQPSNDFGNPQQQETLLSWNMAMPGLAGPLPPPVGGANGVSGGPPPPIPPTEMGPAFNGIDGQGFEEDGYYYYQPDDARWMAPQRGNEREMQGAMNVGGGPEVVVEGGGSGSLQGRGYGYDGVPVGVGGLNVPPPAGWSPDNNYAADMGYGYSFPPPPQEPQMGLGYYDGSANAAAVYGGAGGFLAPSNNTRARPQPLPMTVEEADNLVAKIQDRVRNAFPSLRLIDPANADAMTEMFLPTSGAEAELKSLPELVSPAAAKVPVPTTEVDELTDLLEAEFTHMKALLECYEPPLQEARGRLAMTLMVSRSQHDHLRDWTPYVEQSDSSDEDDDSNSQKNEKAAQAVKDDDEKKDTSATDGQGNRGADGDRNTTSKDKDNEKQLPALLPYLLTSHEGTELCAMLATFYPQAFTGLLARYCLPFLLDNDVVQWVCLAALRADPSPHNPLVSRVLQHWVPLTRWLNAFILLQAQQEERKGATTANTPSVEMRSSATAKRLVSQLGNTMDLLLSGLSQPQRAAAANTNATAQTVNTFVKDLEHAAGETEKGAAVSTLLWGADGAARRTLLRLYLSADIINGLELAAALFTEPDAMGSSTTCVRAVSRDSFYFLLVALSKSLLSPTLNPQTAAFCGRYLQYMEVTAASSAGGGTEDKDCLGEREGAQLVETAFKHLAYTDAYAALRQAYLVASGPVVHFPSVLQKLANEVPPFPLSARPEEFYDSATAYAALAAAANYGYGFGGGAVAGVYNAGFYGDGGAGLGAGAYYYNMGGYGGYPPSQDLRSLGGLLDASSPTQPEELRQPPQSQPPSTSAPPRSVDWTVLMKSYPASGEPFTPLPPGWTVSLSRSFGQYYFKPSGSGGGSPSYMHPTDKTTFYASPQAFIKAEANRAAALHEVIQSANARRKQQQPPEPPLSREEVDAWLNDQRIRNTFLDAAAMEKFSIHYRSTTTAAAVAASANATTGTGAATASTAASGRGGRKRSRSPGAGGSATGSALSSGELAARLARTKNYPAKGAPYPDIFRGWSANMSSSTGLYVFRPPAGRKNSSNSGSGSEAQETHPGTKRRYRVSPQEFVRHRNLAYEDIAKEAKVELVEVREWMTDQRYRSTAMDAAVVKLARIHYVFREELDAERAAQGHQNMSSSDARKEGDERGSREARSGGGGTGRSRGSRRVN